MAGERIDSGPFSRKCHDLGLSTQNVRWVLQARVVDLGAAEAIRAEGGGEKRITAATGMAKGSAAAIRRGKHWQQDPEKVRAFNLLMDAHLDPVTGFPTPSDLERFGAARPEQAEFGRLGAKVSQEKRAEGLAAVEEAQVPARVSTQYIVQQLEQKIGEALRFLDPDSLKRATAKDLASIISTLVEKRQLLRGEPTAIVSYEQRGQINDALARLMAEAERRGIKVPRGEVIDVVPEVV